MVVVDVNILQIVIAVILPLVIGLVTTKVAHPGVKSVLLALAAAATAIISAAIDGGGVFTTGLFVQGVTNFVVAVASYYGLWKPTTIAGAVNDTPVGVTLVKAPEYNV